MGTMGMVAVASGSQVLSVGCVHQAVDHFDGAAERAHEMEPIEGDSGVGRMIVDISLAEEAASVRSRPIAASVFSDIVPWFRDLAQVGMDDGWRASSHVEAMKAMQEKIVRFGGDQIKWFSIRFP